MKDFISGKIGEAEAYAEVKKRGLKIIKTNYKNKIGEIDIIAKDKDYFVFIEVKARSTKKFGLPRESVTYDKQRKIRLVALAFLKQINNLDAKCRFDVIDILDGEITYIENAF